MPDEKVAVLASGGLDSAVLVAHLAERAQVQPIYVRFGLRWEEVEEAHLRIYLGALARPAVRPLVTLREPIDDLYGAHWSVSGDGVPDASTPDEAVFLPGRNLLLLSKASVWCALNGFSAIALGVLKGNPFPDATPAFCRGAEVALGEALERPLRVLTPFGEMTKREVLALGRALPLERSFSCIAPDGGRHCGRCNKCAERRRAFAALELRDGTPYA
jgi:7-cyano-7-deazaguanine synthase